MTTSYNRRTNARNIRFEAARSAFIREHLEHPNNGEEVANPNYIANFHKGLPQNNLGEVNPEAYRTMLRALYRGKPADFERILLDGTAERKLANPQAGLAYDLEGPDGHSLAIPPAPRIDSPENSGEMGELYWMALLRDVHFNDFGTGIGTDAGPNTTADAAASLSTDFSDFRGPKESGAVTTHTLFRGITPGDLSGPFLSQFLLKDIAYGTLEVKQLQKTVIPAQSNYLITEAAWLDVQRGQDTSGTDAFDLVPRHIRNMRDLANYVHFDALYQAYLNACLILLDIKADLDYGNPYSDSINQEGFGTFGAAHILTLVPEVTTRALKAIWFQKWFVHRRLRPETFGGRIHFMKNGAADYPINSEILNSNVLDRIHTFNQSLGSSTYLLPMVFPEGSPMHPAYGAGHATVAGACVTILKAFFDESHLIPDPKEPNSAGGALEAYTGLDAGNLTVGGELNKLAANISIGRNMAGVHWRTDYTESIKLGENIAINLLRELKSTYNEDHFFTLTKFDGEAIVI